MDLQDNLGLLDPLDHRDCRVRLTFDAIISINENKGHLHRVCTYRCLNNLMYVLCVCMCCDMAMQLTLMNVTSRKELLAHLDPPGYKGNWDRKVRKDLQLMLISTSN